MGNFERCYKCEERYPGCQDHCPTGIELKRKHEERKKKIDEAKAEYYGAKGYIKQHYEKYGRKK